MAGGVSTRGEDPAAQDGRSVASAVDEPAAWFEVDPDGRLTSFGAGFAALVPGAEAGASPFDALGVEDRELVQQRWSTAVHAGAAFVEELRLRVPGGGERRLSVVAHPRGDSRPAPYGGILLDRGGVQAGDGTITLHERDHVALLAVQRELAGSRLPYEQLIDLALLRTKELLGADGTSLEVADEAQLVYAAGQGIGARFVGGHLSVDSSLSGLALRTNAMQSCVDAESDPRVDLAASRIVGLRSMLVVPVTYERDRLGVLKAMWVRPGGFGPREQHLISLVAAFVGALVGRGRAQQAADAQLRRYEGVANAAPAIVWSNDRDGRALLLNERWYAYTGLAPGDSLGSGWLEVIHPDEREEMRSEWARCLAAAAPYEGEARYRRADGTHRWHLVRCVPQHDEAGAVTGWNGFAFDIDEMRAAQATLERSEARFRALVEAGTQVVWSADAAGNLSDPVLRWSELIGIDAADWAHLDWLAWVHPDDREPGNTAWMSGVRDGRAFAFEQRVRIASGEERTFLVRGVPVRGSDGAVREWVGADIDVTERRMAEQRSARREERARFFVDLRERLDAASRPAELMQLAARSVADFMRVSFANFSSIDLDAGETTIFPDVAPPGREIAGTYPLTRMYAPATLAQLTRGEEVNIPDVADHPLTADRRERFAVLGIGACLVIPIMAEGTWTGALTLAQREPRSWEREDLDILRTMAERVWLAYDRALLIEQLRDSEERFRSTFEQAAVGMAIVGLDGRWLRVNSRLCEILGYDRDELERMTFQEVTHPNDLPRDLDRLQMLVAGDAERSSLEKRYVRKGGEPVWVNITVAIGGYGDERYLIAATEDISARKAIEAELERRRDEVETLVAHSPDAIGRVTRELRYVYANPAIALYTGIPPARFIGQTARELGFAGPAAEQWEACVERAFSTGVEQRTSFAFEGPRGAFHLETSFVPERDAAGEVRTVLTVSHDVTATKLAEQALRESEERFKQLAEHLDAVFWLMDWRTQEALYVSPAFERHWGAWTRAVAPDERFLGVEAIIHPDDKDEVLRRFYAEVPLGTYDLEFRVLAGETVRWMRDRAYPIRNEAGEVVRVAGLAEDITERKRLESERRRFLDAVAHDLKNPLAAFQVQTQLLERRARRDGATDAAWLRDRVQALQGSIGRMNARIDELADVTQLEAGEALELHRRPVDAIAMTRQVAEAVQQTAPAHAISVDAAETELVGRWDPPRIERVLFNLIGNAVKYSPRGGNVRVGLRRDGNWAVLTVADEGIGIPAADLLTIFTFRHRASNVGTISGTGVGLAGSAELLRLHGGQIAVESREGAGSTFTVRLPLA